MRIALITLEYLPFHGGIAHYYGNLVKYYPEKITVIDNYKGLLVNEKKSWFKWSPAIKTFKKLLSQKYNYFLIGQILPLGTVAWLWSIFFDFKYTVFLHGNDLNFAIRTKRKKWLTRKILNKADKIIIANSYTAERAKKIIDQKLLGKIKIVNPGVDVKIYEYQEYKIRELKNKYKLNNKIILLGIGRLVKRKGFDIAIQSFQLALQKNPNLIYVIIGVGEEKETITKLIQKLKITNQVIMLGKLNEQDKNIWLQTCDVFIMTSRNIKDDIEGFGIVYLEANLAGKPVIAGKSGGVNDAVENNTNGLLIDGENIEAISKAILNLTEYNNLRKKLGDQGRQRVIKNFNWEIQAQKIYNIIHNLK